MCRGGVDGTAQEEKEGEGRDRESINKKNIKACVFAYFVRC